jgi:hypothetical protein
MPGELLTIREAAKRLRVPEVNLWHLIQAKKVPSVQIKAGQWRVSAAVVSALSGDLPDKPRTEPLPPAQGNKLAAKAAVDSKRKSKTTGGKKLRRTVSEISDELLTIEDAAKRLRIRPVDIRRLLRQHKLPAVEIDSYEWRVPAIALLDYIGGVGGNDEAQRRINSAVAWAREKLTPDAPAYPIASPAPS